MTLPSAAPNGSQRPRLQCVPLSNGSAGQEAVELAASAGLLLDPWQAYVLENSLGERADGRWAARNVGLIVSRQNGKGSILEARELAGLFLLGERELIHTAHLFKTSADHFLRIKSLIVNTPDLMRQVKPRGIRESHGEEGITLKSGARLRFVARSVNGSGRGFAKIDLLVLDEAYDIPRSAASSLLPTQLAASNPQTWYTSSVEDRGPLSEHLKRLRDLGRSGGSSALAYFEWSAPDDCADPDDLAARAQANPGLGIRLAHEDLQSLREGLDAQAFLVEHMSVWPNTGVQVESLFGVDKWEACAVPAGTSRIDHGRCFGIAVTLDRSQGCISAAGFREDGRLHVEPVQHAPGVDWIVARAVELQAKWSALFVIDGKGPAKSLIPALQEAGVKLVILETAQVCDSFDLFFDAVQTQSVAHMTYPELEAGVAGANTRYIGDRKALGRKVSKADISPIESVELAAWGSLTGQVLDYDVSMSVY
jgi:hypothetical protein